MRYDAVVVGSGPNGLSAAVTLARAGRSVLVVEANDTWGGGARTEPLTLPGFHHDVCSAVHPLGIGSPFFRSLDLEAHGLTWIHPPTPLAHPFDDAPAATLERDLVETAAAFGRDEDAWRRLFAPLVRDFDALVSDALGPPHVPRHPWLLARFGLRALQPATRLVAGFSTPRARGLLAGIAAHANIPLDRTPSAAFAVLLGAAGHAVGWPSPRGGARAITDALVGCLRAHGGEIRLGWRVRTLDELPTCRDVLLDLTPAQVLAIAGDRLPAGYRRALSRFRYGPGAFKVDWALDGPIPWRDDACARAGTVHLGGTVDEIAASERAAWSPDAAERPFLLLGQQSRFDPTRAPEGRHTAWAYCHVPNGCTVDVTERIEAQVERFAPGFRDRILARAVLTPAELERGNANLVGGDLTGGAVLGAQAVLRPAARWDPYATPVDGLYLCSASTPPGAGVHGLCGYHAARSVLRA